MTDIGVDPGPPRSVSVRMADRLSLDEIAEQTGTDKHEHGYCPHYERHLGDLRNEAITLLEIGVWRGASLRMWEEFFPKATIIGLDIDPLARLDTERVTTHTVDVKEYVPEEHYDVVIDDGSHLGEDIAVAVTRLWPFVKLGGWYVIEDLQTQFSAQWGGGPKSPALHQVYNGLLEVLHDQPEAQIVEFHAYPQIVFLRKVCAP